VSSRCTCMFKNKTVPPCCASIGSPCQANARAKGEALEVLAEEYMIPLGLSANVLGRAIRRAGGRRREFASTAWIFSVSSASPLVFESFDPGPSLFLAIWSIARTNSHSVVASQRPHPDSHRPRLIGPRRIRERSLCASRVLSSPWRRSSARALDHGRKPLKTIKTGLESPSVPLSRSCGRGER
jgi:hypothetical protein